MKTKIFGLLLFWASNCALAADIISPVADKVDVTIYRDDDSNSSPELVLLSDPEAADRGLLMVNETRTLDLPAGESRIVLRGVADAIIPKTAKLQNLAAEILESNFDYNIISPYEIFNKSVGQTVTVVSRNPFTGVAVERSAVIRTSEQKVLLEVDGHLEEFSCTNETQEVLFHKIPEQLSSEPTLSVVVRAPVAGHFNVQLSYLAVGAQWSADYVATLNRDGKTMDLLAWMTLVNARATTFANAPVQVVAGKVERDSFETMPPKMMQEREAGACWPAIKFPVYGGYGYYLGESESLEEIVVTGIRASQTELGDYKLYTLPGTTTLSARQSKQVLMIDQKSVPFEHIYHYKVELGELLDRVDSRHFDADDEEEEIFPTFTRLRFLNTAKQNLGIPLPSGNFSVMQEHSGHSMFVGQASIRDQAVGLPFDIDLGANSDVVVSPNIVSGKFNKDDDSTKIKIDVLIKNNLEHEALAEIQLVVPDTLTAKILSESHKHRVVDGHVRWLIKLRPSEIKHLEYEVFTKDRDY